MNILVGALNKHKNDCAFKVFEIYFKDLLYIFIIMHGENGEKILPHVSKDD